CEPISNQSNQSKNLHSSLQGGITPKPMVLPPALPLCKVKMGCARRLQRLQNTRFNWQLTFRPIFATFFATSLQPES
ncbi:MAG: hypothetical protein LUC47_09785, partial [Clostridiales bacterium]|nr:hypothetical protein [Clostridiales bacterium]